MEKLQKLMDDISEWSDRTFGDKQRNPAIVYHLQKEVPELIDAINKLQKLEYPDGDVFDKLLFEYADCFMLLLDSASHAGISARTLLKYTRKKLEINKNRKWGNPDENGVIEHLKS
jgi:NTP pyrophosphatase (non-canonical NTP hydrolase)